MPDPLNDYFNEAAESFVQTAVFIDDQIYHQRDAAIETIDPPPPREPATSTANAENHEDNIRATATRHLPAEEAVSDSYEIINSFARKKIACSIYEPKKNTIRPTGGFHYTTLHNGRYSNCRLEPTWQ